MARAEFESQEAVSAVIPDNSAVPVAWGYFQDDPSKSFYMTRFRNLRARPPPLPQFLAVVKKLHQTSVSPTGKFGFHCTTYWGPPPLINDWTDSWEEYWSRQLRSDIAYAQRRYGEDEELITLVEEFIQKAVARLLRPLQTGGRTLKPSLCHGGLWDANVQIDVDTKQIILLDPSAFYGHGEALANFKINGTPVDFQAIGEPRYALQMSVVDLYKAEVGASEPQDDFYDRHYLYGIMYKYLTTCVIVSAKDKMRLLLQKFPDGFEGFKDPNTVYQKAEEHSESTVGSPKSNIVETAALGQSSEIRLHDDQEVTTVISLEPPLEEENQVVTLRTVCLAEVAEK
ncbi:hypothetical protein VSDG_04161 [Cytospora chrysosperma]|uniref:protein-ribulosamine 3-kinase n=1 Tax=Cytospora chrysosperma TaxID=252740 RepID=A0A423W0W0_CYTCH|nr:hypothetical protein VSDG_04161 [Valsa sordida]